jgi:uncharacterized protein YqjF (DUF2071 family)
MTTLIEPKAAPATTTPPGRVFLSAQWRWLAVLNYEIDPALLKPLVPRGTELDFDRQGKTYVSLVGFLFKDTRVLGWSLPGYRDFEELNLRYYVVRRDTAQPRRGVVFIKELVPRAAVSAVARAWYNENYATVPMRHEVTPGDAVLRVAPAAKYEFRLHGEWNSIRVACHPEPSLPVLDSHEAFILEHYWGYCHQRDGGTIEYRVDHPRWTVWPGLEAELDCDFARVYGEPFAAVLSRKPDSIFIADGSAVTVAKPVRIC